MYLIKWDCINSVIFSWFPVLGALLGGDLGNSNGACPSPVRKFIFSFLMLHICVKKWFCADKNTHVHNWVQYSIHSTVCIFVLEREMIFCFWLTGRPRQNISCVATGLATCTRLTQQLKHSCAKTPVNWRQLRVTVQAACKQSKEQNEFQVVAEKLKESVWKEENYWQQLKTTCMKLLFCAVAVSVLWLGSKMLYALKLWQYS